MDEPRHDEGLDARVREGLDRIDPRDASKVRLEDLAARVRIGKFGRFVEVEREPGSGGLPETIWMARPVAVG